MVRVPHAVTRIHAALRTSEPSRIRPALVGGFAGLDLTWQSLVRFSSTQLGQELLPAVTSFLVGGLLSLGLAPDLVAMPLYGYLIYVLTPVVLPDHLRHLAERRDFRLLAAGLSISIPIYLFTAHSFLGLGLIVLVLYLLAVQRRSFLGVDGYPIAFMNAFHPGTDVQAHYREDLQKDSRSRWFWPLVALFSVLSVTYTYIIFLVLGGLVSLLFLLYPFPELLCLGWVGYKVVMVGRLGRAPEGIAERRYDLESRVIAVAGVATEGLKGLLSVLLTGLGLIVPVIFVYLVTHAVGTAPSTIREAASASLDQQLAVVFGLLTIAIYGLYGVWYWFRTLFRLPHVLVAWRSLRMETVATPPARELGPLLGRPPGYFLPVTGLLVALGLLINAGAWPDTVRLPPAIVGAWLLALGGTAWSVYRGLVAEPQAPASDLRALPAAYVIDIAGVWVWIDLGSGDSLLMGVLAGTVPVTAIVSTLSQPMPLTFLGIVTFPLYCYFAPDLFELQERADWRQFLAEGYFLATSLALGAVAVMTAGTVQRVASLATLIAFLLGLIAMVQRVKVSSTPD